MGHEEEQYFYMQQLLAERTTPTVSPSGEILVGSRNVYLYSLDLANGSFGLYRSGATPGHQAYQCTLSPYLDSGGGLLSSCSGRGTDAGFGDRCGGNCAGWIYRNATLDSPAIRVAGPNTLVPAREIGTAVPPTVAAGAVAFTDAVGVLGQGPDGTVWIVDGDVLWGLKDGTLHRVYQAPADTPMMRGEDDDSAIGAVSTQGTVVVPLRRRSGTYPDFFMHHLIAVNPDGTKAPFPIPATIPGVAGDPGSLAVSDIVSDNSGGFYIRAGEASGEPIYPIAPRPTPLDGSATHQYVLHVRDGKWNVVAESNVSILTLVNGKMSRTKPVDALKIPIFLPGTMAVLPGTLVLTDANAGGYAMAVGIPR
ncbi:MAG: hypothetical protein HOW97_38140 [Catenulispora sp.]|nr:hypothetical protein [Catenulispora sp.]